MNLEDKESICRELPLYYDISSLIKLCKQRDANLNDLSWTTSEYHAMVIKPNPEDF
jgi:hypothetical protein